MCTSHPGKVKKKLALVFADIWKDWIIVNSWVELLSFLVVILSPYLISYLLRSFPSKWLYLNGNVSIPTISLQSETWLAFYYFISCCMKILTYVILIFIRSFFSLCVLSRKWCHPSLYIYFMASHRWLS